MMVITSFFGLWFERNEKRDLCVFIFSRKHSYLFSDFAKNDRVMRVHICMVYVYVEPTHINEIHSTPVRTDGGAWTFILL